MLKEVAVELAAVIVSVNVAEPVVVTLIDSPEPSGPERVTLITAPGIVEAASAPGFPEMLESANVVGEVPVDTAKAAEVSADDAV